MRSFVALVAVVVVSSVAAIACGDGYGEDDDATPTTAAETPAVVTPTVVAEPTVDDATNEPELPAVSGIDSVDRAIAAALAGDIVTLREMVVFTEIACIAPAEGLGAPPFCREGEAVGTVTDAFPVAHCEGVWERPDELALDAFANVQAFYAAYRTNDGGWPPGDYALIFVREPVGDLERSALELIVTDDGISGMHLGCAMSPETMVEFQGLTDVLIAQVE